MTSFKVRLVDTLPQMDCAYFVEELTGLLMSNKAALCLIQDSGYGYLTVVPADNEEKNAWTTGDEDSKKLIVVPNEPH